MADIVQIAVKAGVILPVDVDFLNSPDFPVESFRACLIEGIKKFVCGKGMSKLTVKDLEGEELEEVQAKIKAQAEQNFQDLCEGKLGRTSRAKSKMPAELKARVNQKALAMAKDGIKRAGYKWGSYSAAEKKEMAALFLEANPELVEEARAELEAQQKKIEEKAIQIPDKFKKAEAKAKPRKGNVEALAKARAKRKETAVHAR